jgi:hypothetical protein
MNKRAPIDIDPRTIAMDLFRRLDGMAGMTKWGKTHRSLAYQLIAKLMAQPQVVTNVNVANVAVDGEAARRKLEDAFIRLIESQRASVGDPAVYVDGERLIEHDPRLATADPQPATDDSRDVNPRVQYRREAAARQREAADARRDAADASPKAEVAQPFNIATESTAREPSTTELYLEWAASHRDPWRGNLG